jgi:hypothetical protein
MQSIYFLDFESWTPKPSSLVAHHFLLRRCPDEPKSNPRPSQYHLEGALPIQRKTQPKGEELLTERQGIPYRGWRKANDLPLNCLRSKTALPFWLLAHLISRPQEIKIDYMWRQYPISGPWATRPTLNFWPFGQPRSCPILDLLTSCFLTVHWPTLFPRALVLELTAL